MVEIRDWSKLSCDCGGDLFEPVVRLKFKSGGGTTTEHAGYRCIACNGLADNARLIKLIEIEAAKKKVKELQAEIGEEPVEAKK